MIPKNEDDIGPSKVLFTTCPSTAPLKTLKIELYLTSSWPWEDGEQECRQILWSS